jgi:peptidoglycan-N-acetylmuramic acid deacetylase
MFITITRRQIVATVAALALAVTGGVGMSLSRAAVTAAAGADWGLSFPVEGQPPVGNATAAELAAYNAYYVGDTAQKRLYLTFDAGYENGNVEKIPGVSLTNRPKWDILYIVF